MTETRTVEGKVRRQLMYARHTNYIFLWGTKKHRYGHKGRFSFTKFLEGLEGKKVKLTLEEIQ